MPTYGTACKDILELAIVRLALVNNAVVRYILLHVWCKGKNVLFSCSVS